MCSCPGRGAAFFTLHRRAGTQGDPSRWTPDQQRTASRCAASGAPIPHPEERALARVSKDEGEAFIMVRDAAEFIIGPRFARTRWRLLTMRPSTNSHA